MRKMPDRAMHVTLLLHDRKAGPRSPEAEADPLKGSQCWFEPNRGYCTHDSGALCRGDTSGNPEDARTRLGCKYRYRTLINSEPRKWSTGPMHPAAGRARGNVIHSA